MILLAGTGHCGVRYRSSSPISLVQFRFVLFCQCQCLLPSTYSSSLRLDTNPVHNGESQSLW